MNEAQFARHIVDRYIERIWEIYWRAMADAELAIVYAPKAERYPGGKHRPAVPR